MCATRSRNSSLGAKTPRDLAEHLVRGRVPERPDDRLELLQFDVADDHGPL
jgi:hypothetical protein